MFFSSVFRNRIENNVKVVVGVYQTSQLNIVTSDYFLIYSVMHDILSIPFVFGLLNTYQFIHYESPAGPLASKKALYTACLWLAIKL